MFLMVIAVYEDQGQTKLEEALLSFTMLTSRLLRKRHKGFQQWNVQTTNAWQVNNHWSILPSILHNFFHLH